MASAAPTATRLRRRRLAAFIVLALAVLATFVAVRLVHGGEPPFTGRLSEPAGGRAFRVTAWNLGNPASVDAATAVGAIDEVDFVWYLSQADGSVAVENEDLELVRLTRRRGLQAFATVVNREPGRGFDGDIAAAILASAESRRRHVDELVALALQKGYDGIDLDWELVPPRDRDRFSAFVEELARALHDEDRLLAIAVFPKRSEPGTWDTQKAADYARLGAAVDEFKIMTYSYSGSWSDPGPQTPLRWAHQVLEFAKTQVTPEKILMGVPFYGYDWHGESTTAVHWRDADATLRDLGITPGRHRGSREATFTYDDGEGVPHTVFFQDREAIAAKMELLASRHADVAGVAIWQMFGEDPGFWDVIADRLQATP